MPNKIIKIILAIIIGALFNVPLWINLNLPTIIAAYNYPQQLLAVVIAVFFIFIFAFRNSGSVIKINRSVVILSIFTAFITGQYLVIGSNYYATYVTTISVLLTSMVLVIAVSNTFSAISVLRICAIAILINCYVQIIFSILQLSNAEFSTIIKIYDDIQQPYWLLINWLHIPGYQRITGGMGQPNELADFLVWGLLANIFLFYKPARYNRSYLWINAVILSIFIAITQSRTAYFYPVILGVYAAFLYTKKSDQTAKNIAKFLLYTAVILCLSFFLYWLFKQISSTNLHLELPANQTINNELAQQRVVSVTQRFVMWAKGLAMFLNHPLIGVGWDKYAVNYITTPLPTYAHYVHGEMATITNSHNLIVQILATTGIVGAVIIGSLIAHLFFHLWRKPTQLQLMPCGILLITLTHSIFEYPLFKAHLFLAAMVIIVSQDCNYIKITIPSKPFRLFTFIFAIIGFWQCSVGIHNYLLLAQVLPPTHYQEKQLFNNTLARYDQVYQDIYWDDYADLYLAHNLMFDLKTNQNQYQFEALLSVLRKINGYYPHPEYALKLAIMDAVVDNYSEASYWLNLMQINYIGYNQLFTSYIIQMTPDTTLVQKRLTAILKE